MSASRTAKPDFSGLARSYRALEFLAFGRDLERTRFAFLPMLRDCRSVLILGEGDGRFLARLLAIAPRARVDCVDGSPGMIAAAEARLMPEQRARVTFACADLRGLKPPARYETVVTLFVLDCFGTAEVEAIVARIAPQVELGGRWLFADFVMPPAGWRRWRARLWLATLYRFFGWQTGLRVRHLPDSEAAILRAGFQHTDFREFQHGMLRAAVFRKIASGAERAEAS